MKSIYITTSCNRFSTLFAYWFSILLIIACSLRVNAQVSTTDSLALVALYNSTNGPAWTTKTNWLTGKVNNWYGITVEEGRVISLRLPSNRLVGNIPASIGNLTGLRSLDLSFNKLVGNIPASLGELSALQTLYLSGNQLNGNIPTELGNLNSLYSLALFDNQFSGNLPASLGRLTGLQSLSINNNQLSGNIPAELGNLTSLQSLMIGANQLTGSIPSEIGNLAMLTYLDLSSNQLSGSVPSEISTLSNLKELYLQLNQLNGTIPVSIGNLNSIEKLYLWGNELSGAIPEELGNMMSLQQLHLSDNQLTGNIPASLGNLNALEEVGLSDNQLSGSVPAFNFLVNLKVLYLSNNQFTSLPNFNVGVELQVANNRLTFESLEYNMSNFSGNFSYIPQDSVGTGEQISLIAGETFEVITAIGGQSNSYQWTKNGTDIPGATTSSFKIAATKVTDAGVYSCKITNSMVFGLTLHHRKIYLHVRENRTVPESDSLALVALYNTTNGNGWTNKTNWLTGPVNTWFGVTVEDGRVTSLSLIQKNLQGNLPAALSNLKSLKSLNLRANQLTGSIPTELGNLTALQEIDLVVNQLSGNIPESLANLINLTRLSLGENQLSGNIPENLGNLANLTELDLSSNQLSGNIPESLGKLANLTEFLLSFNQLGGTIPESLGNLPALEWFTLNSNQLNGTIPESFGDLAALKWFDLSFNQLSGDIPVSLGNLANLEQLNLKNNQLSGTLPESLGNLVNLGKLDLSYNQLSGRIPSSLTKLNNLVDLFISANQFISLPTFTVDLTFLQVDNNLLTFESLEPNIGIFTNASEYSPQDSIGTAANLSLSAGQTLELTVTVGGENNEYQWTKNGVDIIGATSANFSIGSVTAADAGVYSCKVTNTIVPDLTLYRRGVNVELSKFPQIITFSSLPDKTAGDAPFTISATASSGLPVTFEIVSGPATISGSTITLKGNAGTVRVRASQAGNESYEPAIPVEQIFTVQTPNSPPSYIINPSNGGILTGIILYLYTVPEASTYTIEVSPVADFTTGVISKTTASRMSTGTYYASFPELLAGQTYYARVKTNLSPAFGRTTSFTRASVIQSAFVSNPSNGGTTTGTNLYLNTVPGATSYTVELSTAADFTTGVITKTTISRLSTGTYYASFPELALGQTYYARVKTNLSPNWGRTTSFTTAGPERYAYITNPANGGTTTGTNLYLNTVPGATSYTVELSTAADFTTAVITKITTSRLSTGTYYASFPALVAGQTYYARVKTNLSPNWGRTTSFTKTIIVNSAIAKVDFSTDMGLSPIHSVQLYPNPFAGQINIQVNTQEILAVDITILDLQGRIYSQSHQYFTNQPIQLGNDLKPGVYLLKVSHTEFTQVYRIIKL